MFCFLAISFPKINIGCLRKHWLNSRLKCAKLLEDQTPNFRFCVFNSLALSENNEWRSSGAGKIWKLIDSAQVQIIKLIKIISLKGYFIHIELISALKVYVNMICIMIIYGSRSWSMDQLLTAKNYEFWIWAWPYTV